MNVLRNVIRDLEPYLPGKQLGKSMVKLNANENPYPPAEGVLSAIQNISANACQIYPDAQASPVRMELAQSLALNSNQIIVGNGSDDILTMIMRTFLDAGDKIAVIDPTYTLYQTLAAMQGATTMVCPLNADFSLPEMFFGAEVKLTFLPNPNAQTGNLFSLDEIEKLCSSSPGIVVVDEAYGPFAGLTAIGLLEKYSNLIITKTLSKSNSLAGLRIGFGISNPEIIANLFKVKDSYNVNAISQVAAIASIQSQQYTQQVLDKIIDTRNWFSQELQKRGWMVYDSYANFVLTKPADISAYELVQALEKEGFLIRYFNTERLKSFVRISIGTDQQMQSLLKIIDKFNV